MYRILADKLIDNPLSFKEKTLIAFKFIGNLPLKAFKYYIFSFSTEHNSTFRFMTAFLFSAVLFWVLVFYHFIFIK